MKYDVAIIGAGPAGLFTAYKLIEENKKLKIVLLERGSDVEHRVCPMNKNKIPCQNCNPCAILSGYGGAGTFSDGKLNFIPKLGKSDLTKYMLDSASPTSTAAPSRKTRKTSPNTSAASPKSSSY